MVDGDNFEEDEAAESADERYPELPIEVKLTEDIGAAALLEAQEEREVQQNGDFEIDIVDLPKDGPRLLVFEGRVQLDQGDLDAERESVNSWLLAGIANGDQKVLGVYLRNLEGSDEEIAEQKTILEQAFESRSADKLQLDALEVDAITEGISTRNLIRKGIREELVKQPCYFRDRNEQVISGEDELDIVIVKAPNGRRKNSEALKLIVGSKNGIGSIVIPEDLDKSKFVPDLKNVKKNKTANSITIPLKNDGQGNQPTATSLEIYLGPIDVIDLLAKQDEKARIKEEEEAEAAQYSPPPPRPRAGSWTSSSN